LLAGIYHGFLWLHPEWGEDDRLSGDVILRPRTGYLKHGITDDFFVKTQDDTFPTAVNNATDIVGFGVYRTGFIARKIEPNGGVDKGGVITPEFLWLIHPDCISTFPLGSTMAES
jgi:hypothetical protein